MGVCNRGKCFIYASNYDGEKNQTGGIDHPYVPSTTNVSLNSAGPFYRGSNYDDLGLGSSSLSFYLTIKNMYLGLISSPKDFDPSASGYTGPSAWSDTDFLPVISSSYNITEEKVSYQNPVILHITTTFKRLTADNTDRPIYGIILYGTPTNYQNSKGSPIIIAYEPFDEPINISQNDTITFTMIVK